MLRAVFADGFPYLLALDSSLHELNKALDEKVTINRFRPKYDAFELGFEEL